MRARYVARVGSRERTVEIREVEEHYEITIDGDIHRVDSCSINGSTVRSLLIGGRSYETHTVPDGDGYRVYVSGRLYPVEIYDEVWARAQQGRTETRAEGEEIQAPIPGLVVKLLVDERQTVAAGQPVLVLEAMKMQNELTARHGGIVGEILVNPGDTVAQGQRLLVLKPA
jgi:pyruvate carboxylase subunit B